MANFTKPFPGALKLLGTMVAAVTGLLYGSNVPSKTSRRGFIQLTVYFEPQLFIVKQLAASVMDILSILY
ncbi:MAG: hypothetical protein IPP60_11890 [Sphingobacteriales bacterium]|nr:hypothetical protein [Sphingobacteriales bacterium]